MSYISKCENEDFHSTNMLTYTPKKGLVTLKKTANFVFVV